MLPVIKVSQISPQSPSTHSPTKTKFSFNASTMHQTRKSEMINMDSGSNMMVTIKTTSHGNNNQSTLHSHGAANNIVPTGTTTTHNNLFNYYNSTIQQSEDLNLRFGASKRKSVQYATHGANSPMMARNISKHSDE